jgi:hypothetical protein
MEWTWWILLLIIPSWFLRNCYHELSHLIVGRLHEKRDIKGFWPWPHCFNGRFYFSRYRLGWPKKGLSLKALNSNHWPRHIAPFYADLLLLVALGAAMILSSPVARPWFLPPMGAAVIDAFWFWRGYFWGSEGCDGKRWRYGERGKP